MQENQQITQNKKLYLATIVQVPQEKSNSYAAKIRIEAIKDSIWQNIEFQSIAYFEKSKKSRSLDIGKKIVFYANMQQFKTNSNPYTFNYLRYMWLRHVRYQAFIHNDNFKQLENDNCSSWLIITAKWQRWFVRKLEKHISTKNERGVILAMLLGYREELTPEVKETYADAGAMHVLAISGLHIGILYLLLRFFSRPFKNKKTGKLIYIFLSLSIIWIYASITGFFPSVARAATMFSIFIIGEFSLRKKNIYNSVAASALILLLIDPHLIFFIGFQLSYLAVISILFFQPIFYRCLKVPTKFLNMLWQLTTVSLAVQIGTFPLTMYYFNQFPVYFLITNLFVIKGTIILMYIGFLFIAFSWLPSMLTLLGEILSIGILYFNQIVFFIDNLPYSSIEGIVINGYQFLMLYIMIITLSIFFLLKKRKAMFIFILSLIIFWGFFSFRVISQIKQNLLIIHDIPKKTAIHYIMGKTAYILIDSTVNEKDIRYNIQRTWLNRGIKKTYIHRLNKDVAVDINDVYINNHFLISEKLRLAVFYDKHIPKIPDINIKYCIIKSGCDTSLFHHITTSYIVLDGSLNYYERKKWKMFLENKDARYHDINKDGAMFKSLK